MDYTIISLGLRSNISTDVERVHDFQLLRWTESDRLPHKTYRIRQPQKKSKHTLVPVNRFNKPFRKHLFKVGKSKK